MNALAVAADQMMPGRQVHAELDQAVGARIGQPVEFAHIFGRDLDAVGHPGLAAGIVRAAVGAEVKQAAGGVGERDLARVLVLDPDLAAQTAAVA